jgi:hypothetical protein
VNAWTKTGLAAGGLLATGALAVLAGGMSWQRASERAAARLTRGADARAAERGAATAAFWYAELGELPPPVVRYFMFALRDGQPRVRAARLRWIGEFRTSPTARWMPFTAEQSVTVDPPGFTWDAAMRMAPGVTIRVRDGYDGGEASMLARLGGLVTMVDQRGTTTLAEGALLRWLGEAVWLPTALLPTPPGPAHASTGGVRWEAIDDGSARLVLVDRGHRVEATLHVAPSGAITRVEAMRWRDVDGTGVPTPFEGTYGDWERRDGMMVPTTSEVAWLLPAGRFAYWRGRLSGVEYRY